MPQGRRSTSLARSVWAVAAVALAASLGGCAEVHRGVEAVARVGSSPAEAVPARADVMTVRPPGAPRVAAAPVEAARPVMVAAVPAPRDIFNFHPAGSRPDSWRQPFVIDTSDGPLAADVRRSSAELKAFMAGRDRKDSVAAAPRRCSETDVATDKAGCVAAVKTVPAAGR